MNIKYLSCAETAKRLRRALKTCFPGVKFSVRSKTYSGGGSITVYWWDGPAADDVERVAMIFEGACFDGMIDLKTANEHWLLPDGSVTWARTNVGHSFEQAEVYDKPEPEAILVRLGADFVFCARRLTAAFLEPYARSVAQRWGHAIPVILQESREKGLEISAWANWPSTSEYEGARRELHHMIQQTAAE